MKKIYLFFREKGFYSIELENDQEAIDNAKCNDGTLKVTDIDGNIIWEYRDKI